MAGSPEFPPGQQRNSNRKERRYAHSRRSRYAHSGRPRYAHSRRSATSWPRRIVAVVAVVAISFGFAIGAHIYLFYRHSDRIGQALIHTEQRAAAKVRATGKCVSPFPTSTTTVASGSDVSVPGAALAAGAPVGVTSSGDPTVYALLKAPSIGLVAPVVNGAADPQLSVAVGHVVASSWPGASGTSVLAAHDVTWFSQIDKLNPGDKVSVVTPCQTFVYTVDNQEVVAAGTPIDQTTAPRLVLITCYPLDALFLTSQRYMLNATLSEVVDTGSPTGTAATGVTPVVPAPAALVAEGLDLEHNPAPLGSLSITGSPTATWRQSSDPLDDEAAMLELYFAALRSAEQDQPTWWAAIASSVPYSAASHLVGANITYNDADFNPSLDVTGDSLTGASLTTEPVLIQNDSPGTYRITMTASVVNGQLVVTGWTMARA